MSSYTWFYHVVKGRMGKKTNALPSITVTAGEVQVFKLQLIGITEQKMKFNMQTWKRALREVIYFFSKEYKGKKFCRETPK